VSGGGGRLAVGDAPSAIRVRAPGPVARGRRIVVAGAKFAPAISLLLLLAAPRAGLAQAFPHADHEGLFPVCAGCHQGIEAEDPQTFYPDPDVCTDCHDGVREEEVTWQGPQRAPSNVVFDHAVHRSRLVGSGDPAQSCEDCHSAPSGRMSVDSSEELGRCWGCHAHETESHFELSASCERCHVPLAATAFDGDRIASLPRPEAHDSDGYVLEGHGRLVSGYADRCATCHTADRCLSCHVDGTLLEIAAIPRAPDDMRLPAFEAEYPSPPSHVDEGWIDAHQLQVPVRECSTCHTQDDCRSCHEGLVPRFVEALPTLEVAAGPGVGLVREPPETHGAPFFQEAHPALAASDDRSCRVCHRDAFCVECHDAPVDGAYHPGQFLSRHAADAFGREQECATCHSSEVFCRACHVEAGLTASGRLGAAYHDAGSLWLLRHGQAARQGLESCASCHRQTDCVQCHGTLGAFSVSPHSQTFDAERAWARSPRTCLACHLTSPIGSVG
jgi:hypothetical protein